MKLVCGLEVCGLEEGCSNTEVGADDGADVGIAEETGK